MGTEPAEARRTGSGPGPIVPLTADMNGITPVTGPGVIIDFILVKIIITYYNEQVNVKY